jgi:hypothetical protein
VDQALNTESLPANHRVKPVVTRARSRITKNAQNPPDTTSFRKISENWMSSLSKDSWKKISFSV